jgi:hypothetical protein
MTTNNDGSPATNVDPESQRDNLKTRWSRPFRFALDALGLWVTGRKLRLTKGLPEGFPQIASLIASDPDHLATVYKRFDNLAVRNLLLLEARVAALESIQKQLDREDLEHQAEGDYCNNFAVHTTPQSFEYFACLAYPKKESQRDPQTCPAKGTRKGLTIGTQNDLTIDTTAQISDEIETDIPYYAIEE